MAAETLKFKIDDVLYEMPEIDDLDIEEWEIIYGASGIVLGDFAPALDAKGKLDKKADADRQRRISQPAFLRARLHIAYRRANPAASEDEIEEVVKAAKMVPAMEAIADAAETANTGEGDAVPPALTPAPDGSSPTGSDEKSGNKPTASAVSSETPAEDPATTGTSGSGMSSQESRQKTSVA